MSEFKPRYLAFGGRGQRDEITPRGRVYWGGEWGEAEREEARRVDEEMSEQTVEEARRQGLLHMRRLEVWRQFARYSVRGDEVRDEVDAALDAFAGEALREREAEVERLREIIRQMLPYWYEEYRGLGYGNCVYCGAGAVGFGPNTRVGKPGKVDCEHEPGCLVPEWSAALKGADDD